MRDVLLSKNGEAMRAGTRVGPLSAERGIWPIASKKAGASVIELTARH